MKVFWSWQSDHDGKVSHYLIRDALEAAIEKLKLPKDIEEPSEAERRANLELDHDTKGETGGPILRTRFSRKSITRPFSSRMSRLSEKPVESASR
jgi:hypothetical protein